MLWRGSTHKSVQQNHLCADDGSVALINLIHLHTGGAEHPPGSKPVSDGPNSVKHVPAAVLGAAFLPRIQDGETPVPNRELNYQTHLLRAGLERKEHAGLREARSPFTSGLLHSFLHLMSSLINTQLFPRDSSHQLIFTAAKSNQSWIDGKGLVLAIF